MNTKHRSILLCAALCGAWMWTAPAHAQLVGGALGGGASGALVGGPGLAVGGDLRMDATGSVRANPGELRTAAGEARREVTARSRAARERASAEGRQAVETTRSTAAGLPETNAVFDAGMSGRIDASQGSTADPPGQAERKAKTDAPSSDASKTSERAGRSSTKSARSRRDARE